MPPYKEKVAKSPTPPYSEHFFCNFPEGVDGTAYCCPFPLPAPMFSNHFFFNPGTTRTCANNGDCTAQAEDSYCETFYDTCDTPGVCMCNEGLYMSADGTCLSGKELWGSKIYRNYVNKCQNLLNFIN